MTAISFPKRFISQNEKLNLKFWIAKFLSSLIFAPYNEFFWIKTYPKDAQKRIVLQVLAQPWKNVDGQHIWPKLNGIASCSILDLQQFVVWFHVYDPMAKCNELHTTDGMELHRWQRWHSLPMSWYAPIRCLRHWIRHQRCEFFVLHLLMPRQSYRDLNEGHVAWHFHREYGHREHDFGQSRMKQFHISCVTFHFTCSIHNHMYNAFIWLISWRNSSKGCYRQRFVRWHADIIIKTHYIAVKPPEYVFVNLLLYWRLVGPIRTYASYEAACVYHQWRVFCGSYRG